MSFIKIEELQWEACVGSTYNIPVLYSSVHSIGIPIIDMLTSDDFGHSRKHWHCDLRFIDKTEYEKYYGHMFRSLGYKEFFDCNVNRIGNSITFGPTDDDYIDRQDRVCLRKYGFDYMASPCEQDFIRGIRQEKLTMKCNTCPHRGYNLNQAASKNGLVRCPMHGALWNVETGKYADINKG